MAAKKVVQTKSIVIREMALAPRQQAVVSERTPEVFIRTKPGRGSRKVQYVEGGYVVNKLNEAFSAIGWEFDVVERGDST